MLCGCYEGGSSESSSANSEGESAAGADGGALTAGDEGQGEGTGGNNGDNSADDGPPETGVDDGGVDDGGGMPAPFDPSDPESYTRKVKLLLTGEPVLDSELALINEDPSAFRDLVETWTNTESFHNKMLEFFSQAFQQDEVTKLSIIGTIRGREAPAGFNPPQALYSSLSESFARTAWNIVEQNHPFTEVATTQKWMMTTAMMSLLALIDDPIESHPKHTFYRSNPPQGMSASSSMAQQIANRAWYVSNNCLTSTYSNNQRSFVFSGLTGRLTKSTCGGTQFDDTAPIRGDDFSDWREVEIVSPGATSSKVPYYDIPALRGSTTLVLDVPRTGYFSTPAFLSKWRSNIDNSFRVTTNQALIVGLGQSFDDEDTTLPLDDSGLSDNHADPTTTCYGCHSKLDPMRNFFAQQFDPEFYAVPQQKPEAVASFGFFGHITPEGGDLRDLGEAIATHPMFPAAWVQKLCFLANSQQCNLDDPEFQRVVDYFIDSNYNFRELVIELFSSPLITGAESTLTHQTHEFLVSIARREHLCKTLGLRLQNNTLCNGNQNVANAIPEDAWSRGSATPFQPASTSLFYTSSMETFCLDARKKVVDKDNSVLQSSDMEGAIDFLVETVMDISAEDSRFETAHHFIESHIESARTITNNDRIILESAFTLACTSPFVTAVGL